MNTETIYWRNASTGEIRKEIRVQLTARVWKSETDGRYYTKGILGWWDITDSLHRYDFQPS